MAFKDASYPKPSPECPRQRVELLPPSRTLQLPPATPWPSWGWEDEPPAALED